MSAFKVVNLGCKVNRAESDSVEIALSEKGMHQAESGCDVVVVNTCTVTSIAEKKTRKAVRRALSDNPNAKVIVTGCAAVQSPSVYEQMSDRVEVVAKWDLGSFLDDLQPSPDEEGASLHAACEGRLGTSDQDYCRANVKIQDGCRNACSYCIIHKLRGPETSTDPSEILKRVRQLADSGITEVILSGINLARYSFDGTSLADLCEMLAKTESRCRFRLSSIEPNDLSQDVIDVVSRLDGRICRHFHLPLQSGCDETLSRMNRGYSSKDYMDTLCAIRERMPDASISTDVICGFPGESEEEFEATYRFCEEAAFSKMHVFPFSPREGTPAIGMGSQIDIATKNARAKRLRELAKTLRARDLEARRGTTELAVVEDGDWCMTDSYHRIRAPKGAEVGSLIEIEIS